MSYMSPEQVLGETVDGRSDLYALGCMLYELVTGALPFVGDSQMATMMQHLSEPPPRASSAHAAIPEWLDDVLLKLLAKKPAQRFASARDLAATLRAGLDGRLGAETTPHFTPPSTDTTRDPVAASTGVVSAGPRPVPRRSSGRAWVLGGLVALAGAVGAYVVLQDGPPQTPAADGGALSAVEPPVDQPSARHTADTEPAVPRSDAPAPMDTVAAAVEPPSPQALPASAEAPSGGEEVAPTAQRSADSESPRPSVTPRRPAPAPAEPATVTLRFDVKPAGASIWRAGERVGTGPTTLRVARSEVAARYTFKAAGRKTVSRSVTPSQDRTVEVALARTPAAPKADTPATDLMRPTLPGGPR